MTSGVLAFQLISVETNLTATVNIGQDLVVLIDRTIDRIERNEIPDLQLPQSTIDSFRQLTDDAAEDVQDIASVLDEVTWVQHSISCVDHSFMVDFVRHHILNGLFS